MIINFSEPLEKGQDFKGLVAIQNTNNLKFSTQGNVLKVYFNNEKAVEKPVEVVPEVVSEVVTSDSTAVVVDSASVEESEEPEEAVDAVEPVAVVSQKLTGELLLEVFQGIESEYGKKLIENYSEKISFDEIKPNVRFIKNGTILPSSSNLKLNFEAVNLKCC